MRRVLSLLSALFWLDTPERRRVLSVVAVLLLLLVTCGWFTPEVGFWSELAVATPTPAALATWFVWLFAVQVLGAFALAFLMTAWQSKPGDPFNMDSWTRRNWQALGMGTAFGLMLCPAVSYAVLSGADPSWAGHLATVRQLLFALSAGSGALLSAMVLWQFKLASQSANVAS